MSNIQFLRPRLITIPFVGLILLLISSIHTYSQGYIKHSRVIGSATSQSAVAFAVEGGYSYILGTTSGNDYPITLGGTSTGTVRKGTLTKLDATGNVVWSRYLPSGNDNTDYKKIVLSDGVIYLLATTSATDLATTNGSVSKGLQDIVFTKVAPDNGNILMNSYLGGTGNEVACTNLVVENGYIYFTYVTSSPDIPVTTGSSFTGVQWELAINKLDLAGNTQYTINAGRIGTGGTALILNVSLQVVNNMAYLAIPVTASSLTVFPTTDGSAIKGVSDIGLLKLDANGNRIMAKLVGGSSDENIPTLIVENGEIYLAATTRSADFPVTDGSVKGVILTPAFTSSFVVSKFTNNGDLIFSGYRTAASSTNPHFTPSSMQYKNGSLYLAAGYAGLDDGITDGSTGTNRLWKINATTGVTEFSTRFGERRVQSLANPPIDMIITNDAIYTTSPLHSSLSGSPSNGGYTTDGSTRNSISGTYIAKHSFEGKLLYGSFLTATSSVNVYGGYSLIAVENGKLYVSGGSADAAAGWPSTMPPLGPTPVTGHTDLTWTVLDFCPAVPTNNTITPLSQTICQNGLVHELLGDEVIYSSLLVPKIYINGAATDQSEIRPRYQWQSSTTTSGPWINILSGIQRDYIPPTGTQTLYYRRVVLPPAGCGDDPVSISPVAEVVIGNDAAPVITSGVFNTCLNTPVNISASVTGGTAPYVHEWDNGISSTTGAATVTPTANSVYTLTVTDANGCQQIGQVIVNAYTANAGPATAVVCAGKPVRIGTPPPAGLTGVTYQWTPATGLDDPAIAQPLATPGVTTNYTLSMTVPISGGGTCTTTDNITVNIEPGPASNQFAGPDMAVAKGGTVSLGAAAETGFTYTWTPGSHLSGVAASTTNFSAGSNLPSPNPYTYNLTAVKNGCFFTDQVSVAVLEVDAGEDYCGPRTVGTSDYLSAVTTKTYLWEVVSGPGTITGTNNTPTTTVSASSSNTTYRITLTYLGVSVSDEVVVGPCGSGGCPDVEIDAVLKQGCPSTALGQVTLKANPASLAPGQWMYTWTSMPAGGLSATTGPQITLTDNVERDVTVTISRLDNPAVSCSETIHVNDPLWSLPVVNVPDKSACPGAPVSIGTTAVSGYSYTWQNVDQSAEHDPNPLVSPASTTFYPLMVEDNLSGCRAYDTVTVTVQPVIINPGSNWIACSNALIRLGSSAHPGFTYSWDPQVASYQNGTTYQSAMPQVLVATTQNFTLTVTDTETGCTLDSTVVITIDDNNTLPAMLNPTICKGESVTIGMPEMTGVTYNWSPATGLSSSTIAQPTANPASTQVYTLSITYYDAGGAPACTKTGTVTVTVALPEITMSDESICPSGPAYSLGNGVTVSGASTYSWEPAILATAPSSLHTSVKSNPTIPTAFTLTATDANGCSATASKIVSPTNAAPEAGSSGFVCVGESRTLGNTSNAGTINWTVNPAIAGTLSTNSGAETVFEPSAGDAGKTFIFTISQDIGGCINTDKVQVQVRNLELPSIPAQTICMNSSATIGVAAKEGVAYAWTPDIGLSNASAATTSVSNITATTKYTLTAVDNYGCAATTDAVLGVNPLPAPTVSVPDVTVAQGSAGIPFNPQVSPVPADYIFTWTPPAMLDNPYISNTTALPGNVGTTVYTLSVTADNGCTATALAKLIVVDYGQPADISTVKRLQDATKSNYLPGEEIVYIITVTNHGPATAYNLNISDVAQAGTTINSWVATVNAGAVTLPHSSGTGNLNETINTFPNGATVTYEVTVGTTTATTGPISNTVTVASSTPDPSPVCMECVTAPLPKAAVADIVTVKTLKNAAQTAFIPGQPVIYTITITNNGPDEALNVTVIDNAPTGTTIDNWTATVISGAVTLPNSIGTGNINETISSFPDAAVVVYEVSVLTPVNFTGNLINTSQTTTITHDPDNTCTGCTAPPVNPIPPPVASNDDTTTKDGIAVMISVLDNDSPGPSGSSLSPGTIEIVAQPAHGSVIINADGTITYVNTSGYTGVDSFTYRVKDENGLWSNVATVTITIVKNEVHVPNIMTPNGDGKNDKLIIGGLEKYQANQLLIFNRWNNKVYESKNYNGDWNAKGLNPGTYFYTLKLQDKNGQWQTVNGYITLIR